MKEEHAGDFRQSSDPEAWLENHGDYLFRYALVRLRDKDIAGDMVQETFLAALKGKNRFKGAASERTWLVGILKHKIIDYFRRISRESPFSDLLPPGDRGEDFFDATGKWRKEFAPEADDPMEHLEKKEFWETFEACLSDLPRRLSRVFALREFEEMKGEEICNLLNISATNLSVMLYRARLRLGRCLEIKWFSGKKEGK